MMKLRAIGAFAMVVFCSAAAEAGAVGGPKETTDTVLPFRTDVFTIKFESDELAVVTIRGDGSTDLDFYVYDSNDNLVAKDDDSTDLCRMVWSPTWTGYFKIKIVNRGSEENRYRIITN
jgi:hypothetical protein